jgi:hypothetical protein
MKDPASSARVALAKTSPGSSSIHPQTGAAIRLQRYTWQQWKARFGGYTGEGATPDEAERALQLRIADCSWEATPPEILEVLVDLARRFGVPILRRKLADWEDAQWRRRASGLAGTDPPGSSAIHPQAPRDRVG